MYRTCGSGGGEGKGRGGYVGDDKVRVCLKHTIRNTQLVSFKHTVFRVITISKSC
jgi:hypothetical protein